MFKRAVLSTVACVLLGTIPATASTIDIGLAQSPGIGSITTQATGTSSSGAIWAGSYAGSVFNLISASGSLNSASVNVSLPSLLGGGGSIYVYVTETGLTSPQSTLDFLSNLSVTSLPAGWSETETTYVDTTNKAYGMGTQLASMSGLGTQSFFTNANVGSSPFSLTEMYLITSNGSLGVASSSESISATPLPSAIPLFASGLGALGLLGWFGKRKATALAA
jgi:hypothetical protein